MKTEGRQHKWVNSAEDEAKLNKIQDIIGYHFNDISKLRLALTHSSFAYECPKPTNGQYNERIEYLGDAVLELISTEFLYTHYEKKDEGQLTKMRASLVCEYTLAQAAKEFQLGEFLFLSRGEEKTNGREKDSILSDAFEALLGAIYLDGGIEPARTHVVTYLLKDIEHKQLFYDAKTNLQEYVQQSPNSHLEYVLIDEIGPSHAKEFIVEAKIDNKSWCQGHGCTKKAAEQMAAYQTLLKLKQQK